MKLKFQKIIKQASFLHMRQSVSVAFICIIAYVFTREVTHNQPDLEELHDPN